MITPLRRVGAGGDQENVMFLVPEVTVKFSGGPVGAGEEYQKFYIAVKNNLAKYLCV